jgi:hypothetical protein
VTFNRTAARTTRNARNAEAGGVAPLDLHEVGWILGLEHAERGVILPYGRLAALPLPVQEGYQDGHDSAA